MKEKRSWTEKYRPKNIYEVYGEHEFLNSLITESLPHLIFVGPSGTGKTSQAEAICKKIAKEYINENCSDYNGIDTIRNKIQRFCTLKISGLKCIILDEADFLSYDAQRALRNLIEYHSSTTRFIILCNNLQKLIDGLQSRCMRFTFPAIPYEFFKQKANEVAQNEEITIDNDTLQVLFQRTKGDLRQMITLLEYHAPDINQDTILQGTGIPYKEDVIHILHNPMKNYLDELLDQKQVHITSLVQSIAEYIDSKNRKVFSQLAELERHKKAGVQEQILRHYLIYILSTIQT